MKNFYTSLETSKQLKEWGCIIPSRVMTGKGKMASDIYLLGGDVYDKCDTWKEAEELTTDMYTYHLLEDICCTHAEEFFDEHELNNICAHDEEIFYLIKQDKKEEAEKYFLLHTIYNPRKKEI